LPAGSGRRFRLDSAREICAERERQRLWQCAAPSARTARTKGDKIDDASIAWSL
jgi:hypothetical protein